MNALGADGPIAKVVDAGAETTHAPELFRSVEARALSSPVAAEVKKNIDNNGEAQVHLQRDNTEFSSGSWGSKAANNLEKISKRRWAELLDACSGAHATAEEADCLDCNFSTDYNFSTLFYAFLTFSEL